MNLTGARWVKSSRSASNGICVEVARNVPGVVGTRDSKDPEGGHLAVSPESWTAFANTVKAGRLDR
jgi:hypothetical protein